MAHRQQQSALHAAARFSPAFSLGVRIAGGSLSHQSEPSCSIEGQDSVRGVDSNLEHIRVFGSCAYVCAEGEQGKMTNKGWRGRLVGWSESVRGGYLIYNENTRQVVVSRNVTFIETPGEAPAAAIDVPSVGEGEQQQQQQPQPSASTQQMQQS